MPNGLTTEQWQQMQSDNPEGYGQYVAIQGSQYATSEQQAEWQQASQSYGGVQQVGNTLYGYMPTSPSWATPEDTGDTGNTGGDTGGDTGDGDGSQADLTPINYQDEVDQNVEEGETAITNINLKYDTETTDYITEFNSYTQGLEDDYTEDIAALTAMFDTRQAQLEQYNRAHLGGVTKLGIRSGRQRYAGEIHQSIISSAEAAGLQRLAELDAQELQAKSDLRSALRDKKWNAFNHKTEELRQIHQNKVSEIANIKDEVRNKNLELRQEIEFGWTQKENNLKFATTKLVGLLDGNMGEIDFEAEDFDLANVDVDNIIETTISNLSEDEIEGLEDDLMIGRGGLRDYYEAQLDNKILAKELDIATKTKDNLAQAQARANLDISILETRLRMPMGQAFDIDGKTYTGLKSVTASSASGERQASIDKLLDNAVSVLDKELINRAANLVMIKESMGEFTPERWGELVQDFINDLPEEMTKPSFNEASNLLAGKMYEVEQALDTKYEDFDSEGEDTDETGVKEEAKVTIKAPVSVTEKGWFRRTFKASEKKALENREAELQRREDFHQDALNRIEEITNFINQMEAISVGQRTEQDKDNLKNARKRLKKAKNESEYYQ